MKRWVPQIEELETRQTPATLVSPKLVTYQDADGDLVKVRLSQPLFTADNVDQILKFDTGLVDGDNSTPQQLQTIDLTGLTATKLSLTVKSIVTDSGGDGRTAVGFVNAAGLDMKNVVIDGDLGRILVGDADTTTRALRLLKVHSLGASGTATQEPGGDLQSVIEGRLGKLRVITDIVEASLKTTGGLNGSLGKANIGGSIMGGAANNSGELVVDGLLGLLKIGGDIVGSDGDNSGQVLVGGLNKAVIKGDVVGGTGIFSGQIFCNAIGKLRIDGDIQGGSAFAAGQVFSNDFILKVVVGGSLIGAGQSRTGGIFAIGGLGTGIIRGDIVGGSITGAVSINNTGYVQAARILKLVVHGSIIAGTDDSSGELLRSGSVVSTNDIGLLRVRGSLVGNATKDVAIIAAGSPAPTETKDVAIRKLVVRGSTEFATILAGYNPDRMPVNPDAQILTVVIKGDFVTSSIVAGIDPGGDGLFGTGDDAPIVGANSDTIVSLIRTVRIKGNVVGSATMGDHFGIVAERVGKFVLGGVVQPLTPGPGNDVLDLGTDGDVKLLEL